MTDLERSDDELRAAIRLAGKRLKEYNRARDKPLLATLRRVLREARKARKSVAAEKRR